jgi:pSer/pThr/pTyr-binding forkhead associated (FHA) protein
MTEKGTDSLARSLARNMLGTAGAPTLELVKGPGAPASRPLHAPGEPPLSVGRGDDASWPILDEDLSRIHAELVRDWDAVTIRDLESKNGTQVDGVVIAAPTRLVDGARIAIGNCEFVFRDPQAPRHVHQITAPPMPARANPWSIAIPAAIAVAALGFLIWILTS